MLEAQSAQGIKNIHNIQVEFVLRAECKIKAIEDKRGHL